MSVCRQTNRKCFKASSCDGLLISVVRISVVNIALCHIIFELYKPGAPRLELFDTGEDAMTLGRGYLFSLPERESEGVRVLVHSPA